MGFNSGFKGSMEGTSFDPAPHLILEKSIQTQEIFKSMRSALSESNGTEERNCACKQEHYNTRQVQQM